MTSTNAPTPRPRMMSYAERQARYGAATPTIHWNATPADRSKNGMRVPRSVHHKGMR